MVGSVDWTAYLNVQDCIIAGINQDYPEITVLGSDLPIESFGTLPPDEHEV